MARSRVVSMSDEIEGTKWFLRSRHVMGVIMAALPIVLLAASSLLGCAGQPGQAVDPKTSYLRGLQVYLALASSMATYCEQPGADAGACKHAAQVAQYVAAVDTTVTLSAGCQELDGQTICAGDYTTAQDMIAAAADALRAHAAAGGVIR